MELNIGLRYKAVVKDRKQYV